VSVLTLALLTLALLLVLVVAAALLLVVLVLVTQVLMPASLLLISLADPSAPSQAERERKIRRAAANKAKTPRGGSVRFSNSVNSKSW